MMSMMSIGSEWIWVDLLLVSGNWRSNFPSCLCHKTPSSLCLVRNLNRHYQDPCHAVSPVSPKNAVFEPWTDDRSSQFLLDQIQNTSPSVINYWLVVTGTWLDYDFPSIGNGMSSNWRTHSIIFQRGRAQPPIRLVRCAGYLLGICDCQTSRYQKGIPEGGNSVSTGSRCLAFQRTMQRHGDDFGGIWPDSWWIIGDRYPTWLWLTDSHG